jgi:hypothetical protein
VNGRHAGPSFLVRLRVVSSVILLSGVVLLLSACSNQASDARTNTALSVSACTDFYDRLGPIPPLRIPINEAEKLLRSFMDVHGGELMQNIRALSAALQSDNNTKASADVYELSSACERVGAGPLPT